MSVRLADVTVRIDDALALDRVTVAARSGGLTGLIGPNGSGKSTLLRTVFRALRPRGGAVEVEGRDVWSTPAREVARQVAVVLQDQATLDGATVEEVVALGRIPHRGTARARDDRAEIESALTRTETAGLRARPVASLSGGQRQRVQLARALAQATPVLLLDEPTNHLDIGARVDLLALVRGRAGTTVAALHDLDLAAAWCDHLVVLHDGRVAAAGPPRQVLTAELVARVYGVEAEIATNPLTGRPTVHLGGRIPHLPTEGAPCARPSSSAQPPSPR